MEVSKRNPCFTTYRRPKDMQYYNSTICSYIWQEVKNRVIFNKNEEKRSPFCLLGGACKSLVPVRNGFSVLEEPNVYSFSTDMARYSAWKSNMECLRLPPLCDPYGPEIDKSSSIRNISVLKEITRKLLNIFHLEHICYLVKEICERYMMANDIGVDLSKMNCGTDLEKSIVIPADPEFHERVIESKVVYCDIEYSGGKKNIVMNSLSCSSSTPVETLHDMKSKLKDVNKEMSSRKQRQINKHSKKRKRRLKKKNKNSSPCSLEAAGTSVKASHPSKSSQMKCESQVPGSLANGRSKTILHDWEDSDEDLCIVFEDEVDCVASILPENLNFQCTGIEELSDLWIEFDSFTIVSGSSGAAADKKSCTPEILIHCDSDSEYEAESAQIFTNANEFDSLSGLLFLNNAAGCPGLQSSVHNQSFVSRTSLYEPPQVYDDVETYEIHKINKRWKEMTSDVDGGPRLPQRVSFAPEEDLVAVFPADMIDRKSEWEQYAIERFRFKRRVNEFEKIITPYFTPAHREKVCRRMRTAAS